MVNQAQEPRRPSNKVALAEEQREPGRPQRKERGGPQERAEERNGEMEKGRNGETEKEEGDDE